MLKYKNKKIINLYDWDKLVQGTYNKPYNFQQQNGCQDRGTYDISIPDEYAEDFENDSIVEKVNGPEEGVSFKAWLARDPKQSLKDEENRETSDFMLTLFWDRNFYPNIETVANDLYSKGLIKKGNYSIKIDW